jgi:hypothetical protein
MILIPEHPHGHFPGAVRPMNQPGLLVSLTHTMPDVNILILLSSHGTSLSFTFSLTPLFHSLCPTPLKFDPNLHGLGSAANVTDLILL